MDDKKTSGTVGDGKGDLMKAVDKVEAAENILVALSENPSVDEMTAAIGLTLVLDGMGKHATAIYSGKTPDMLKFLNPEKTFETNTNSLQDFIIALDKEKADHLRYKIEGDFVKVYITPYKTTLSEKDLKFSHGAINVDLIITLNVTEEEELDAALAEHGRILHDASEINISCGVPGRLGGIEWNRASASSVSEMIVILAKEMKQPISRDAATALLTGIVAATERFSNEKTRPETMAVASELMGAGADQQLVAANVMKAGAMEAEALAAAETAKKKNELEPGSIDVSHEDEAVLPVGGAMPVGGAIKTEEVMSPEQQLEAMMRGGMGNSVVMNDHVNEAATGGVVPSEAATSGTALMNELQNAVPEVAKEPEIAPVPGLAGVMSASAEPVPSAMPEVAPEPMMGVSKDYGAMMEEALAEPEAPSPGNPAGNISGEVQLPPPPVPPMMPPVVPQADTLPQADTSAAAIDSAAPEGVSQVAPAEPLNPVIVQPNQPAQDSALVPPVQDPGAFKIPGV